MTSRLSRLQGLLKRNSFPNLLVTNLKNIEYLTGLKLSAGMLLVTQKSATAIVDGRYIEKAKKDIEQGFFVVDAAEARALFVKISSLVVEGDSVTLSEASKLKSKLKIKKLVQSSGLIEGLRRTKDSDEIRCVRRACSLTKSVLRAIPSLLKTGMTERELASILQSECLKRGADGMAFDTIVGFGPNTSSPHHRPTHRRLGDGDIVQIDMGAMYRSYCSDFSRVYVHGRMKSEYLKTYRALQKAKKSAESLLRIGVSTHALDRKARSILRSYGIEENFPHALGHGVGMDIHEGVVISTKRPNETLKKGDVITIEPGAYFPGKFGMRIEDTHIIGE